MAKDYVKRKYLIDGVSWKSPSDVRFYASFTRDGPIHPVHGQCWQWKMSTTRKGYGSFTVDGRQDKAHRASYKLLVGPIPDGLHVLHKCDNPACVNPAHLFLGTNPDNVKDKMDKNRQAKGEAVSLSRLTRYRVQQIRRLYTGGVGIPVIAKLFEVHKTTINAIVTWKTWKHVVEVDPEENRVKSLQKLLREFGPSGTVIKEFLTEDQVQELYSRLGNNVEEDT